MSWKNIKKIDESSRSRISRLIQDLPVILLIVANIFLFIPFAIYQGNLDEFSVSLTTMLRYFILPSLLLLFFLAGFVMLLKEQKHKVFLSLCFIFGFLLWLQGNVLVWQYGLLNGQGIDWSLHQWRGWLDGGIWFGLLAFAFFLNEKVYKIARFASVMLLILQSLSLGFASLKRPEIWRGDSSRALSTPEWAGKFSRDTNVIHLILDGLQSDIFRDLLTAEPSYEKALDGFTFFEETLGSFPTTYMSIPAILTGRNYQNDMPMKDFVTQSLNGESIPNLLHDNGYEVDFVPDGEIYNKGRLTHYYQIPHPYVTNLETYTQEKAALMLDLTLFRVLPHFSKKLVYNNQSWLVQRVWAKEGRREKEEGIQYRQIGSGLFLKDLIAHMTAERSRPTYKFVHLMTTHPPFVLNEKCEYIGSVVPNSKQTLKVQARCGINGVLLFLERLKEIGIYDRSLIIIQADHGSGEGITFRSDSLDRGVSQVNERIAGSALPLLLIKPPAAHGPLKVTDALVSLSDIPATLCSLLHINGNFTGRSVFEVDPHEQRTRNFYYYRWKNDNWQAKYFPSLIAYEVDGSAFESRSWRVISNIFEKNVSFKSSRIAFGSNEAHTFLRAGWGSAEHSQKEGLSFAWALGRSSSVFLAFPKKLTILTANMRSPFPPGQQVVTVKVDGRKIGRWKFSQIWTWEKHSVTVPADEGRPDISVVQFEFSKFLEPTRESQEKRSAAVLFESITLRASKIEFGSNEAFDFLGTGWGSAERSQEEGLSYSWALRRSSSVSLALPKKQTILTANMRSPFPPGQQVVTVKVDGRKIGRWKFSQIWTWEKHSVTIPADVNRPDVSVLEFVFSKHLDAKRKGQDKRPLAVLFESIALDQGDNAAASVK